MTLDELAIKHGTDKSSLRHGYCEIYEKYLEPIRNNAVKLLEIGVQFGFSLKMWADYFSHGSITGIDVVSNGLSFPIESRIQLLIGDGPRMTGFLDETFDVIVDDGSHNSGDILHAFWNWWPKLKHGGFYFIEDVHACYRSEFGPDGIRPTKYFGGEVVDLLNWNGDCDICNRNVPTRELSLLEKELDFIQFYRGLIIMGKK